MLKRWITQFYKDGIYTDSNLDMFVSAGDLTSQEAEEIKNSKEA